MDDHKKMSMYNMDVDFDNKSTSDYHLVSINRHRLFTQ